MPTAAPRRCRHCKQLTRGRCTNCDTAWATKPKSWTGGSTRAWRKIRAQRLSIEPFCRQCGAVATEVDHIDGTDYATQRLDLAMTRSLCGPCHRTRTNHQAQNAKRQSPKG